MGADLRRGLRQVEAGLGMGDLLVVQFEVVDVAGIMLALGDVRGGFVDLDNEGQPVGQLLPRLHRVEGRLSFVRQPQDLVGDAELDCFEVAGGHLLPGGQHEEVEEVLRERIFGVEHEGRAQRQTPARRQLGILQARRLRQFRLRDADGLELGLQRAVVQQRDGDGRLRGEVGLQQRLDGLLDFIARRVITHPAHFLAAAGGYVPANVVERGLGIRARAASERQRQRGEEQDGRERVRHFFSSVLGFGWCWP